MCLRSSVFCILLSMAISSGTMAEPDVDLARLVIKEIDGWRVCGEDKIYDRKTLFSHIDGGAEVYLTYNFRQVLVRCFKRSGHPSVHVELYDMGSPQDAFGIFSFEQESEDLGIGQGSEYAGGLLRFWKDRIFVCAFADKETPEAKEALFSLGKSIAKAIGKDGEKPAILDMLPETNLAWESIRYFHHYMCLNYHYFVADLNLLNLDGHQNAVFARYTFGKDPTFLLLIQYQDAKSAKQALASFTSVYMPEAAKSGAARMENGKWTAAAILERSVFIVFEAPSEGIAKDLLESVRKKLKERNG